MSTIELTDCGPVKALSIPVQPGVVVLRGRNDIGKSESLKAVSKLLGGKETISCRQGAVNGTVEGFGVKVSLGKARTSARGELEALSIEGNLPVAELARKFGAGAPKGRFHGAVVEADLNGQKALLLSPTTFMNLSGTSVQEAKSFYKLANEDLLVVCDDLNLPVGKLRCRARGSR